MTSTAAAPAIIYERLTRRFAPEGTPALDAIEARIEPGRITGLVGPDGAGKTTLLRLTAGLLLPTSGSVRVADLDPVADAGAVRARIGYMPQRFGLYEDLSVLENLSLYADLRGVVGQERSDAFAHLLAFTDLAQFTARPAGKLSGGMKQKLGLACVLLGSPDVLLLDEPTASLDIENRKRVLALIAAACNMGSAVLAVFHDETERHKVCSRDIALT